MRKHLLTAAAAFGLLMAGRAAWATEHPWVKISRVANGLGVAGLPMVPWVAQGDASWGEGEPLFEVSDPEIGTSAKGWVAVSTEHILMRVVVKDNLHENHMADGDIWNGDALQIGVDARGDGVGDLPRQTPMVGPDDASITVALTDAGPKVWAHFQGKFGRGYRSDGARDYPCSVVRDEQSETTSYEIAFPWTDFSTVAGMAPALGLAVQVNDTDEGEQRRIYWGRGAGGEPRPGLFERVRPGGPPAEVAAAEVARSELWRRTDAGEIVFAVASERPLTIRATVTDESAEMRLGRARLTHGVRRFVVRGAPGFLPEETVLLKAELLTRDGQVLATQTADLEAPGQLMGRLDARIEELAEQSPHPLFTRHLRSAQALVGKEWNRAMLVVDANPQIARDAVRDAATILDGLNGQAADWNEYRTGRRGLVLGRHSAGDGTVQYATLSLPARWRPERAYPLIVSLHGAGPSHPLFYAQLQFLERDPSAEPERHPDRDYYLLAPWGRGNQGYRELAEDDVWEAIDDMKKTFRVDEDRQYLTGHSMGGGGTWSIGLRTPDRWAAICIAAGGTWHTPLGVGLGRNAAHLPVRIWHGDADGAVPVEEAYRMQAELRRHGNEPDVIIVPGHGHGYPADAREPNTEWLRQHTRRRPDSFAYVCDTFRHRGVWGIWMDRDVSADPLPRFECRIEGDAVHINSSGTPGLYVDLGEDGLGLEGEVVVFWNGEKAYEGPVKEIELGAGGGWR